MAKKFSQADLDRLPKIVRRILIGRRIITDQEQLEFLNPDYEVTNYEGGSEAFAAGCWQ